MWPQLLCRGARKGAAGALNALDIRKEPPRRVAPRDYGIFARRSSTHVQSMRGPIGEMMARRSAMSSAVSNGGFAYEDDILEDAIL
jgi:hypothetical protein